MVAVAVVLAASVFVLVVGMGGDVGGTAPKLAVVTDSSATGSNAWAITIGDATSSAILTDYQFVLTTPHNGTIVVTAADSDFTAGDAYVATSGTASSRNVAGAGNHADGTTDWQLVFTDTSGDGKFNTLDKIRVTYDTDGSDASAADPLPSGPYSLDLRHIPTDKIVGLVDQNF